MSDPGAMWSHAQWLASRSAFVRYAAGFGFWVAASLLTYWVHGPAGRDAFAAFLAAIMLTGWYAGAGPAVFVMVLGAMADRFVSPLAGTGDALIPSARDAWFAVFGIGAAWFGVVRRRKESELRSARLRLEEAVGARTAELLLKERYLDEAQRLSHTGCWAFPTSPGARFWWSDEAHRIYGFDPRHSLLDHATVRSLAHPDDVNEAEATAFVAIREHREFDLQHRIVRADGVERRVRIVGRPSFDAAGALVEYIGVVMDITERWQADQALQRAREGAMQARFAARLEERTRLAREMHDTLLQGFTGVALKLAAVTKRMDAPAGDPDGLRAVVDLAQRTLSDAREAIWEMRLPADGTGPDALRAAVEDVVDSSGLRLGFRIRGEPRSLGPEAGHALLRVGREAVRNAVRHSNGHRVVVTLVFLRRCLCLVVNDDGRGFAVEPGLRSFGGHWGLLGMRERAALAGGRLTIRSAPDAGTRVGLLLPYDDADEDSASRCSPP